MSAEQDLANANVQIANLISEVTRFRDAAMGINNIWPTITDGRQNTADGKYFSVPGDGAYLKLYRRAGTSQTLVAEFPDRVQVQGIVDVFGGRGVVGGSGSLMAEGAFGLGNSTNVSVPDNNLNTLQVSGIYRATTSVVGHPDGTWLYQVQHWQQGAGVAVQIAFEAGNITYPKALMRARGTSGNWTSWFPLFNTHNILGTVSHSGGIPTGAAFERGANSFGSWKKTADGIVEFFNPSVSLGAGMTDFVLPFEVVNTNYHVSITPISTSGVLLGTKVGTRTTQSVPIGLVNASGFVASFVQVRVIAYWY